MMCENDEFVVLRKKLNSRFPISPEEMKAAREEAKEILRKYQHPKPRK